MAGILQAAELGTLLMDLPTPEEEQADALSGHLRFDICLLSHRLLYATNWVVMQDETRYMSIGYFGASTGGGAALVAAAKRHDRSGGRLGTRVDLAPLRTWQKAPGREAA